MPAVLACINSTCLAQYPTSQIIYNCTSCGSLLEAQIEFDRADSDTWKQRWLRRRMSNIPLDQSGVWRYREMLDLFGGGFDHVVTLREGNTPLLHAPKAAAYAGLDQLVFKHQGFNPT